MPLKESFARPASVFRGAPFWSLNDRLEDSELRRQIGEMNRVGLGGFFLHSRAGLLTPYMSREWMERMRTCIEAARTLGLHAWLYDEDRWPSGFAGGAVPAQDPSFRIRHLACVEHDAQTIHAALAENPVAVYRLPRNGALRSARLVAEERFDPDPDARYVACVARAMRDNDWFNGGAYLNTLNPRAVDAFIESTYEAYHREFGDDFGALVPGIFTDEPAYSMTQDYPEPNVPWADNLLSLFRRRWGFDLRPHVISLFHNVGDYARVRFCYWNSVTDLFAEAFSRRIGTWCGRHRIAFTGHYLCEDDLRDQIRHIGSAMRHYRWMQLPGVDHLGTNIDFLTTMKQVASVTNQFGRKRILCELYGTGGWNQSLEDQKWIGDWEYALGVNLRCQHLALYTLRGCRKRDFPPSIFYQQPWWPHYRIVEDYFGRLGLLLSQGQTASRLLVVHPIASGFTRYRPQHFEALKPLERAFKSVSRWLTELHWPWDFGDDAILASHGSVWGRRLRVGKMAYEVVLIPPCDTLASSTFDLLKRFGSRGGPIVAMRPLPSMIDGVSSPVLADFLRRRCTVIETKRPTLERALQRALKRTFSVADSRGREAPTVYVLHRAVGSKDVFFLANFSRTKAATVTFRTEARGRVEDWDARTGAVTEIPPTIAGSQYRVPLHLEPAGSACLVIDRSKKPSRGAQVPTRLRRTPLHRFGAPWSFRRTWPNALTLDSCSYRIGDAAWSPPLPVWKVQDTIRKQSGLPSLRFNGGISLWKLRELGRDRLRAPFSLSLRYPFFNGLPPRTLSLLLETPELFQITLNGTPIAVPPGGTGWHIDPSFRVLDIAQAAKPGLNDLVLHCDYDGTQELESLYLIGDFGVAKGDGHFTLTSEPETLSAGDIVPQGYPFYGGTIIYEQEFDLADAPAHCAIEFDNLHAILARVSINGTEVGFIPWQPHRLDCTAGLRRGRNRLQVELFSSLRNMLGPHHHTKGEFNNWVSPESFSDEAHWTDSYSFVPFGLGDVRLVAVTE